MYGKVLWWWRLVLFCSILCSKVVKSLAWLRWKISVFFLVSFNKKMLRLRNGYLFANVFKSFLKHFQHINCCFLTTSPLNGKACLQYFLQCACLQVTTRSTPLMLQKDQSYRHIWNFYKKGLWWTTLKSARMIIQIKRTGKIVTENCVLFCVRHACQHWEECCLDMMSVMLLLVFMILSLECIIFFVHQEWIPYLAF